MTCDAFISINFLATFVSVVYKSFIVNMSLKNVGVRKTPVRKKITICNIILLEAADHKIDLKYFKYNNSTNYINLPKYKRCPMSIIQNPESQETI